MRVLITDDYDSLAASAAGLLADRIAAGGEIVLGLPTGGTPVGMYRCLVSAHREERLSFAQVRTFNLDEYVGLPATHAQSYQHFMREHLFDHVDLRPGAWRLPDGMAADPAAECQAYEDAINDAGGIDVQVLGIGTNGHIGFNEPGTPFGSLTHIATLAPKTRRSNARYFGSVEDVPARALSMGIRTIMNAREIVLLASGESKADAIAATVGGPVTPEVPSSVLQLHPSVTVIVDKAAAQGLDNDLRYAPAERTGA